MATASTAVRHPHGESASTQSQTDYSKQPIRQQRDEMEAIDICVKIARIISGPDNKRSDPLYVGEKITVLRKVIESLVEMPGVSALGTKEISDISKPLLNGRCGWIINDPSERGELSIHTRITEITDDSSAAVSSGTDCTLIYHVCVHDSVQKKPSFYERYALFLDEKGNIISMCKRGKMLGHSYQFVDEVELKYVDNERILDFLEKNERLVEHVLYQLYRQTQQAMVSAFKRAKRIELSNNLMANTVDCLRMLEARTQAPKTAAELAMSS